MKEKTNKSLDFSRFNKWQHAVPRGPGVSWVLFIHPMPPHSKRSGYFLYGFPVDQCLSNLLFDRM